MTDNDPSAGGLSCVHNKLLNNIFLNQHAWRGSIIIGDETWTGFESDYNVLTGYFSADPTRGGSGLYAEQGSSVSLTNSILWGNGNDEIAADSGASIATTYSIVGEPVSGTGNLNTNPYFANPVCDFHLLSTTARYDGSTWVADVLHSPAIDAGDPAGDYANELAPHGERVNMGVYGNSAEASRSEATPTVVTIASQSSQSHHAFLLFYALLTFSHLTFFCTCGLRKLFAHS